MLNKTILEYFFNQINLKISKHYTKSLKFHPINIKIICIYTNLIIRIKLYIFKITKIKFLNIIHVKYLILSFSSSVISSTTYSST